MTLACGLSAAQRARGTTVCVRAFMFNQPVRRNALLAECVECHTQTLIPRLMLC